MDVIPSAKFLVVSGASLARHGYARYPIFSLKATDAAMLSELRGHLEAFNVNYREVALPGVCGEEIGIVLLDDRRDISKFYAEMSQDLRDNWNGWRYSPALNAIPDDVDVPDSCYRTTADVLQQRVDNIENPGPEIVYCLNLVTEEVATVRMDYKQHTYSPDRDISNWKQFGIFESDFIRVQAARG